MHAKYITGASYVRGRGIMVNIFSVPMPFNIDHIERIAAINNNVSKSRIAYMYNTLPGNAAGLSGYEQTRVINNDIGSIEDIIPYIRKVKQHDIGFIYLINSPAFLSENEFTKREPDLRALLERLISEDVMDVRVCNPFILDYITQEFPKIRIRCSTSQEYYTVRQYKRLLYLYHNIVEIVPSWDMNRNILFLESLNTIPNLVVELMVNEGCLSGCPFRVYHSMFKPGNVDGGYSRFNSFFKMGCEKNFYDHFWENICMSNIIYPWQISAYNELGFYNFKLVGRNTNAFKTGKYIDIYRAYLMGVDDVSLIKDVPFSIFSNYIMVNPALAELTVEKVMNLLPDMQFFINNRPNCGNSCGYTCHYCENLAKRLQKAYPLRCV